MTTRNRSIIGTQLGGGVRILASSHAIGRVVGCCAMVAVFAQVRVPLTPVPMTLQLLGVLLAGFWLPPVSAAAALLLYLLLGVAGMPVFAYGSLGLVGPTGGYLVGFLVAAVAISTVRGRSRSWVRLLSAGAMGVFVVFGLGALWQVSVFGWSWSTAMELGVTPFVAKAVIELGLAVATCRAFDAFVGRASSCV